MIAERIHGSLGSADAPIRILYINPNSTLHFTQETITYLTGRLPNDVAIEFYTGPVSAPPSIDGTHDGILSTAAILQDLQLAGREHDAPSKFELSERYSGIVVACFSAHPLVPALKEILSHFAIKPPVVGILESSVLAALQLGSTFGIATTGVQWEALFDEAVRSIGIAESRYTGTKGTGFNAISLHGDGPSSALHSASVELVARGAKVIVLGCAGMAPMRASLQASISKETKQSIPVIDGVQAGIDLAIGFARMGLGPTF
ncbi:hypothetical protein IAT38_005091 [Cryptococcus sp. DSM 104549]